MPGGSSLAALPTCFVAHPTLAVAILTMREDPEYARQALRAGARSYVLKEAEPAELLQAFRLAVAGRKLPAPAARRVDGHRRDAQQDGVALSEREREVVRLIAHGYTNPRDRRATARRRAHGEDLPGARDREARVLLAGGDHRLRAQARTRRVTCVGPRSRRTVHAPSGTAPHAALSSGRGTVGLARTRTQGVPNCDTQLDRRRTPGQRHRQPHRRSPPPGAGTSSSSPPTSSARSRIPDTPNPPFSSSPGVRGREAAALGKALAVVGHGAP